VLDLLERLYNLRQVQPSLFRRSAYSIDRKGSKDANRFERLLKTCCPPAEALEYVKHHTTEWLEYPERFWIPQSSAASVLRLLSPQATLAGAYAALMRSDI